MPFYQVLHFFWDALYMAAPKRTPNTLSTHPGGSSHLVFFHKNIHKTPWLYVKVAFHIYNYYYELAGTFTNGHPN